MPTPAAMLTAVAESATTIRVTFDVAMDPDTITGSVAAWTIAPTATSVGVTVIALSSVPAAGDTQAVITTHPAMTAGEEYNVQSLLGESFDGGALSPDNLDFTVSAAFAPASEPAPRPVLEAWAVAVGREIEQLNGVPVTVLLRDLAPDDTEAIVESTEGYPDTDGAFFAGHAQRRFTYTGRSSGAFLGVVADELQLAAVPRRSEVMLDVVSA